MPTVGGASRTGSSTSATTGAGRRSQVPARSAVTRTVALPARSPSTVSRPTSTVISSGRAERQNAQPEPASKVCSAIGFTSAACTSSTFTRSTADASSILMAIGVLRPMPGSFGSIATSGAEPTQKVTKARTITTSRTRMRRARTMQPPPPERSDRRPDLSRIMQRPLSSGARGDGGPS